MDQQQNLVVDEDASEASVTNSSETPTMIDSDEPNRLSVTPAQSTIQPQNGPDSSDDVLMLIHKWDQRRSTVFLLKHPSLQIRMRSILLDWLIEVSEAHTLHRQTFYLAQDYLDRFMLKQNNIEKGVLQLIGITCLFIASKMEEACPPKVSQMAYVTDGTYYKEEILQMELVILKTLTWDLRPETPLSWLKYYFQLASMSPNSNLLEPQFPQDVYLLMTRLLDLCILNIEALNFRSQVLAASVLCHFIPLERVEKASGLSKAVLQPCLTWMAPFVETAGCTGNVVLKEFTGVEPEDRHNIQAHSDYMAMLDAASEKILSGQFATP
ncbi:G1/S-specific cyclin-E2-like [Acanthochromis polyacanthus]|uniref:G2/mitotic-specific cyclin-B2 n=1 Tax=Acanthochromis polyacanthus TaxID=80966 RepID=A0A3Q1GJS5_9TELE|nr:G1/S-specific cyclin-E2-like [Acanthochromis polyacanthus]XP_051811031.1 G1/S-specific cyclin-E2-like [Acanthochromis polyacanthus]